MAKKTQREVQTLLETVCSGSDAAAAALAEIERWAAEAPADSLRRASALAVLCAKRKLSQARPVIAKIVGPSLAVAYTRAELAVHDAVLDHYDRDERALAAMLSNRHEVSEGAVEELRAWFDANPAQAVERARRILGLALEAPAGRRDRVNAARVCLPLLLRALAPGETLPREYDGLVAAGAGDWAQEVLDRLPEARRGALLQAENARRAAPPTERRARTGGPFRFADPVRVMPRDYAGLDEVGKAQWRATAGGYVDATVRGPRDFIAKLRKQELDENDGEMRRWKVLRGEEHVYDAWIVWVENGAFFRAGSAESVPVYLVQDSYLPSDETPGARALADELEASAPETLWAPAEVDPRSDVGRAGAS